jgi:phytoene dehydrogenase-like protein
MMRRVDTRVLVVGGGPVGLSLAMDLAWRGIAVVVAELRHRGEAPSVKCNHVAARTIEMFRRLGVAASVRDAGLPHDYPNDVAYRLTTTGTEARAHPDPLSRRSATPRPTAPTHGGRHPNHRTRLIKSTSNRSCSPTPRRWPAAPSSRPDQHVAWRGDAVPPAMTSNESRPYDSAL